MNRKVIYLFLTLFIYLSIIDAKSQTPIKLSLGASVGGKGLAGVSAQLKPLNLLAFDLGLYLKTTHVDVFEEQWFIGPAVDCGVNVFLFKKINKQKEKVTNNGLYFKAGFGLNKKGENDINRLNEKSVGLGWLMEISKSSKQGKFLQLQLGPSIIQRHESYLKTRYPPGFQIQNEDWSSAMIYARLTWFFVLIK